MIIRSLFSQRILQRALIRCSHVSTSVNSSPSSELLTRFIKDKVRVSGAITVNEYMKLCVGSAAGYYQTQKKIFGSDGDFITSPELSQLFGELVGVWIYNELWNSGERGEWQLVELGPGRGALMSDILRTLMVLKVRKTDCVHSENLSVHLVEVSDKLIDEQERELCGNITTNLSSDDVVRKNKTKQGIPIFWHRSLSSVPEKFSVFVGNEFFDALPIHAFERNGDQWNELYVNLDEHDELQFMLSKAENLHSKGLIPEWIRNDSSRDKWELCPDAGKIATDIALRGGFALFFDYGHNGDRISRSLRAYRNHKIVDVLAHPGEADITADVDFGYLNKILAGMCLTFGPVTQRNFLGQMGAQLRMQRLLQQCKDETTRKQLIDAYKMLVDDGDDGMGSRFKAFSMFPSTLQGILRQRGGFPAGFFPPPEDEEEDSVGIKDE